jgi:hypothetical protein
MIVEYGFQESGFATICSDGNINALEELENERN